VYKNVWSKRKYSQQHLTKQQFFFSLFRITLVTTNGSTTEKQVLLLLLLNARTYLHYSVMYFLYQMFNEICNKTIFKLPLEYVL